MRLGLVGSPGYPELAVIVSRVRVMADELGIQLYGDDVIQDVAGPDYSDLKDHLSGLDAMLTLGGDGTLLRGARTAGPHGDSGVGGRDKGLFRRRFAGSAGGGWRGPAPKPAAPRSRERRSRR